MTQTHTTTRLSTSAYRRQKVEWLCMAGVLLAACGWVVWRGQTLAIAETAQPHLVAWHVYTSPDIVISQVYGGGGERNAPYKNDFIELFNRGTTTVNLAGWSVQYAAARSIGWQATELTGALAPGQYYLIKLATAGTAGQELPEADTIGTVAVNATAGRVAVVRDTAPLSGLVVCPTDPEANGKIVDFVGYGSTACAEGAAAPAPSAVTAVLRRNAGCADTDQNGADFLTGAPLPRSTASPFNPCNGVTNPQADLVINTITSGVTQTSGAAAARFANLLARARGFTQTQTTPASVPARGLLSFIVTVRNNGAATAANVTVTDTLPAGFGNLQASNGALITGSTVTWPMIPALPRGASASFTVIATAPDQAGSLSNVARCTSDTFDPDATNNRRNTPIEVLAGARFSSQDVVMELFGPQPCSSSFSAEVRLTNRGFSTQPDNPDSEFNALLPPGLTVSSCFASKGQCRTNSGGQSARWDGSIRVNETVTITLSLQVLASGEAPLIPFCVTGNVKFDTDNDGSNDATTSVTQCGEYSCSSKTDLGPPLPPATEQSAQKAGSVLIFNLYTSNASDPARQNTRLSLTNTNDTALAYVHLFFVNSDTCAVSDVYTCLTPFQTTSFLASDIDPGVTGYLVAVAVNAQFGCPINFNYLIGDAEVKLASGHQASLGAESFAALANPPVPCDQFVLQPKLAFDGVHYNRAPRTLAISNLASVEDGNSTLLVLNRLGGDLSGTVEPLGKLAGWLYDDAEKRFSYTAQGGCQLRQVLSNSFPRTTPRYGQIIPSGQTGWLKIWAGEDYGILGAAINFNPNAKSLPRPVSGGQNLHKLTFTNAAYFIMPAIKPHC
ncbi:MAG: lamin tail domain-containing protein [Acidobacteria bacterium]|nr:lamin tail domain-containing protein [Acidobacteriota bacterium]MBI3425047.1 lamin tail domain-containing protein [Acidobacteriota bacterium]